MLGSLPGLLGKPSKKAQEKVPETVPAQSKTDELALQIYNLRIENQELTLKNAHLLNLLTESKSQVENADAELDLVEQEIEILKEGNAIDETAIGQFLEESQYSKESVLRAAGREACSKASGCCIQLISPLPGYQGDNISVPRMAQAEAAVTLEVTGDACVVPGSVSLTEGLQLRLLVDGFEEAVSTDARATVVLPGLSSGNHILIVIVEGVEDGQALAELRSEFVVLADIEILFPSDDFVFPLGGRLVLAFSVSPTALDRFCVEEVAAGLAHCAGAAGEHRVAKGIGISVNGNLVSDFDMKPEDGDDGRRTYHADMADLPAGSFEIGVQLQGPRDAGGGRRALGDMARVVFEVAECAKNGERCGEGRGARGEEGWGGGGLAGCPPLERASCVAGEREECSGHGKCVQGVCLCVGDFIGEHCEVSLFSAGSYLPDQGAWAVRCAQGAHWMEGSRELLARLEALHAGGGASGGAPRLTFATRMHGLGAQMHYLTECLTRAVIEGKAMAIGRASEAGDAAGGCERGGMKGGHSLARELSECYLEPFLDFNGDVEGGGAEEHPWTNTSRYGGDEFQTVPKGSAFWWRAHLALFLLQPGPALLTTLRQVKAALGFGHPVISVHVRHGDACMHASISQFRPKCVEWGVYLERIYEMRDKYGVNRVFLATDDAAVAEAAQKAEGLEVMQLQLNREVFSADWFLEFRSQMGLVSAKDVTESALVDLLLLAEGDIFVGTFASHLSRLAYELMVARLGYFPPFSSVDYPWCFHMMHKDEVPGYGVVNC